MFKVLILTIYHSIRLTDIRANIRMDNFLEILMWKFIN